MGKKILVVDGDPDIQNMMKLFLSRNGYTAEFVAKGEEVLN